MSVALYFGSVTLYQRSLISNMYGLVKKSIQPVYRNSESVRKCNCCRDWLITKVTISKMWNFSSCKVLKQLKFQVFNKGGLILTTQMVRYICFGHIISDGSISNTSEKVFPGLVHRAGTRPELSIFASLCRPTATEEIFAWARPPVNLLCSNLHWNWMYFWLNLWE